MLVSWPYVTKNVDLEKACNIRATCDRRRRAGGRVAFDTQQLQRRFVCGVRSCMVSRLLKVGWTNFSSSSFGRPFSVRCHQGLGTAPKTIDGHLVFGSPWCHLPPLLWGLTIQVASPFSRTRSHERPKRRLRFLCFLVIRQHNCMCSHPKPTCCYIPRRIYRLEKMHLLIYKKPTDMSV